MANFGETKRSKRSPQTKSDLKGSVNYVNKEEKTEVELYVINNDLENQMIERMLEFNNGEQVINYVTQNKKTSASLITGFNCTPESAFNEMMVVKRMFNKEGGRMFKHFFHSYSDKERIDPVLAHEISLKLLSKQKKFDNFQIIAATHVDKNHVHTHFILNTVNMETGKKWQQSNTFLSEMRELSNQLCEEYGLKFSYVYEKGDKYKSNNISRGEYRAKQEKRSWKHELRLTINECMKISKNRQEFIKNMEFIGYKVKWDDSRKYITFTTPDGKLCRNNKIADSENYSIEKLTKRFELNQQIFELSGSKMKTDYKEDMKEDKINKRSWKYPLFVAINQTLKISTSKEEFIRGMDSLGYRVRWEDSRKDITFTFADGRKCNSDKLHPPEKYTRESLERIFISNKEPEVCEVTTTSSSEININNNLAAIQNVQNIITATSRLLEEKQELGGNKNYPLSYLEGQAVKEKMLEKAKGKGFEWEKPKVR